MAIFALKFMSQSRANTFVADERAILFLQCQNDSLCVNWCRFHDISVFEFRSEPFPRTYTRTHTRIHRASALPTILYAAFGIQLWWLKCPLHFRKVTIFEFVNVKLGLWWSMHKYACSWAQSLAKLPATHLWFVCHRYCYILWQERMCRAMDEERIIVQRQLWKKAGGLSGHSNARARGEYWTENKLAVRRSEAIKSSNTNTHNSSRPNWQQ